HEIGHDDLYFFRPIVTPFLRKYDRDITELMQGSTARKDPIIPSTSVRGMAPPAGVAALWQMLDQVPQVFTIRKFPRPGHSKDIRIFVLGDQPQGLVGGKTRISDHHDLPRPCWGHKILQHLSKKDVLMPFDMGVNRGESHGDTITAPTHNEQDHLKPKRIRIMLTVARRMPQGMLPTALVFQCALPDEIQHSIGGRRERSEWGRRQGTHYGRRIPL